MSPALKVCAMLSFIQDHKSTRCGVVVQMWDRDLWIRTETDTSAYNDKFRPAEQLYAACIEPRSNVDFVMRRNKQEIKAKSRETVAAQQARHVQQRRYNELVERQEKLLKGEPSEAFEDLHLECSSEKLPEHSSQAEEQQGVHSSRTSTAVSDKLTTQGPQDQGEGEDVFSCFSGVGGAKANVSGVSITGSFGEETPSGGRENTMHGSDACIDEGMQETSGEEMLSWEDVDGAAEDEDEEDSSREGRQLRPQQQK